MFLWPESLWPIGKEALQPTSTRSVEPDSHHSLGTFFISFFSSLISNASPIWHEMDPPSIFPLNFPHLIPLTWKLGSSD